MDLSSSLSWERLQSVFYRSQPLQSIKNKTSSLGISTYLTVGPSNTSVYTYSEELLISVNHENLPSTHLKSVLEDDHLVIVMKDRVRVFSSFITQEYKDHTIMGKDRLPLSIWDYKNGIAMTTEFHMHQIFLKQPVFPNLNISLLLKDHWFANKSKIVVLDSSGKVLVCNLETSNLLEFEGWTGWYKGCISENGYICLVNGKLDTLVVFDDNLNKPLISANLDELPKSIAWCGDDLVCCVFGDEEVRLIGSKTEYASFWFSNNIVLLQSTSNGLKIATDDQIEFISKVPTCTSNIFSIGSISPGAILLDSLNLLHNEQNSPKAIENLKIINVKKAVDECVSAVYDELDPLWQKRLLAAASFGKDSLSSTEFDADHFAKTCSYLRVLNFLKSIGIHLTLRMFLAIGLDNIIKKLIDIRKIYESLEIVKFLKYPELILAIFEVWAKGLILTSSDSSDDELYQIMIDRATSLDTRLHLSNTANVAFLDGRHSLARKLVMDDKDVLPKIDLLLKMDEIDLALQEATQSMSIPLILYLLLYSKRKMSNVQFTKTLMITMKENNIYQYFQRHDFSLLYDYLRQTDDYLTLARLLWDHGTVEGQETVALLDQASELYGKLATNSSVKRDRSMIDRAKKLATYQNELTNRYGISFHRQTMDETLATLIKINQNSEVKKMVNAFKISDRKYYFLKCTQLAKEHRLKELLAFAKEKKSPIGYLPFFEAVCKYANKKEAAVYIGMLSSASYAEKLSLYIDCSAYDEAITLASYEKDAIGLKQVLNKIPPNETQLRSKAMQHLHTL